MNQENLPGGNAFRVPDDYFSRLEGNISAQTSASLLERFRGVLINMEATFRVPAYYFQRSQAALLNRQEDSRQALTAWSWADVLRPALVCSIALLVSILAMQNAPSINLDQQLAQIPQAEIESYLEDNSTFISENQMAIEGIFKPTQADTSSIINETDLVDEASYEIL